jgi:ApaG protein
MLHSQVHHINVSVETSYIPEQSNALVNEHVFAYTVTITNNEKYTVQLLRRHWIISDSNGEIRQVEGEGVVGQQPILEQGESYSYTSGSCLRTEVGKMEGFFTFQNLEEKKLIKVEIPTFQLIAPFKLN